MYSFEVVYRKRRLPLLVLIRHALLETRWIHAKSIYSILRPEYLHALIIAVPDISQFLKYIHCLFTKLHIIY